MSACSTTRRARTICSTTGWCATTSRPRSRMPRCSRNRGCCRAADLGAIRDALAAHRRGTRARRVAHHPRAGGLPDRHRESADRAHRRGRRTPARGPFAQRSGARGAAAVSARRRARRCTPARIAVAEALDALAARDGAIALPGYTHMQQAMPSTVALWAQRIRRRDPRRCRRACAQAQRRIGKNPLGSAAGYGTPNLDIEPRGHARGAWASRSRTSR